MHGEAHVTRFEMSRVEERSGSAVTFTATLPIVQELFTRTYHVVKGENVRDEANSVRRQHARDTSEQQKDGDRDCDEE